MTTSVKTSRASRFCLQLLVDGSPQPKGGLGFVLGSPTCKQIGPARLYVAGSSTVRLVKEKGMLTLWGRKQRFCDGLSRRSFLQIGALGTGMTLAELLRLRAAAGTTGSSKAVILVYLRGGPSHIDMYDLKPNAPSGLAGEFKPIHSNVPGMDVCELLPRHAQFMDKVSVIRSITGMVNQHEDAHVMTGWPVPVNRVIERPSFGA